MTQNKKIHVVIGTKAQLIKMAPVMQELEAQKTPYNFIFTGQHKETICNLLENFSIKNPDVILYSGKDITGIFQMLTWLTKITYKSIKDRKKIFSKENKEKQIILTHGDTFSTLFGAILGKFNGIKVAHIESGLRSFNIFHPFPEEITRICTFWLSDYYFCPGAWATNNLKKFRGEKINTQFNTLLDSLKSITKNTTNSDLKIPKEKYFICSCHRFENIFNKKRLTNIIETIENQSKKFKCLFILHPPTKKQLEKFNLIERISTNKAIELRPRYDYSDFIQLLQKAQFIMTDGGSNQEECYYLGKPCLLLRKKTERIEGINKNTVISNYQEEIVKKFVDGYEELRHKEISSTISPSKIIINKISELIK